MSDNHRNCEEPIAGPLKVLFLEQQTSSRIWNGIGSHTVELTRVLAAGGHEVHQISCPHPSLDVDDEGVHVHYRPEVRLRGSRRLLELPLIRTIRDRWRGRDAEVLRDLRLSLSNYLAYRRLRIDCDVIEASTYPCQSLVFAILRSKPLVLTRPGLSNEEIVRAFDLPADVADSLAEERQPIRFFKRVKEAMIAAEARGAQLEVVPSRLLASTKDRLTEQPSDAWVIPHIVQTRPGAALAPVMDTGVVVLCVGRRQPLKGCELLVEAAGLLASDIDDLQVIFVGRPKGQRHGLPYEDWLQRRSAELHAPCQFVGHVSREELDRWYAQARVVALPSWFDSYQMVALEAMAAGRPVVCTANVGLADLIAEFDAGTVVPAGDPVRLAEALRLYLVNPQASSEAGARGREMVETRLTTQAFVAQRTAAYQEAIRRWELGRTRHRGRFKVGGGSASGASSTR